MGYTFLTVAVAFDARHLDRVDATLKSEGRAAYRGGRVREALKNQGVHFLSITTVPGDPNYPAFLVIESSHDGGKSEALDCIATQLAKPLKIIFDAAEIEVERNDYRSFLEDKSIETGQGLLSVPGLNHPGVPGMTAARVRQEFKFADEVRKALAERTGSATPLQTLKDVREHFATDSTFSEMLRPRLTCSV